MVASKFISCECVGIAGFVFYWKICFLLETPLHRMPLWLSPID